ncbi:hypothetical protein OL233_10370 [Vagococcus sp. PNs007]|uniref:DUF4375 domain-containing protein n=1 Tax=Vagococcus proximus TaxID=2991417 RepID=A0ABT5X3W2_9ENTE|nr:hypothetical protein [Vagococcus proximus]MDF0480684.1 hypothetical protein [Vagococcus proximus]
MRLFNRFKKIDSTKQESDIRSDDFNKEFNDLLNSVGEESISPNFECILKEKDVITLFDEMFVNVLFNSLEHYHQSKKVYTQSEQIMFSLVVYQAIICTDGHIGFLTQDARIITRDVLIGLEELRMYDILNNFKALLVQLEPIDLENCSENSIEAKLDLLCETEDIFEQYDQVVYASELDHLVIEYVNSKRERFPNITKK